MLPHRTVAPTTPEIDDGVALNAMPPAANDLGLDSLGRLHGELDSKVRSLQAARRVEQWTLGAAILAVILAVAVLVQAAPFCEARNTPPTIAIGSVLKLAGC